MRQIFKILLFSVSILFFIKFIDFILVKPIFNRYIFCIIIFFSIYSILTNLFLNPIDSDYKISTKRYFLISVIRFISTIVFFLFLIKKTRMDSVHALVTIVITYLLFTSFEVYLILSKLQSKDN